VRKLLLDTSRTRSNLKFDEMQQAVAEYIAPSHSEFVWGRCALGDAQPTSKTVATAAYRSLEATADQGTLTIINVTSIHLRVPSFFHLLDVFIR